MFTEVSKAIQLAVPTNLLGEQCPVCKSHVKVLIMDYTCSPSLKLKYRDSPNVDYQDSGKPVEQLGVKFVQPKCKCATVQSKRYEEAYEKREQERERQRYLEQVDEKHKHCTLDNYNVTDDNQYGYTLAKSFVDGYERVNGQGIFFHGPCGTGKSHLAHAIRNELTQKNVRVILVSVPDLFDRLKATFGRNDGVQQKILDRLYKCDVLILDDLGAEKPSEWVGEVFHKVVNYRNNNFKPMIITSNFSIDDIADRFENPKTGDRQIGERIVDRLAEVCYIAEVKGESNRRKRN
ncbi:MAG: ATP-binding protein [Bacilli bacterium]